ncbi:SDR family NAD(P)-dependent oxidoreductase [Enhygromyxa salina]|uniref:Cyclopentanol dehydrogenase n=1 Tax=Enhygromyxa salina TaxID=215803 RepID=A0A2S9YY96_9BACT|nr:SDR family NAD(P)-dependent oxidoreductase [Enhygromyxa salina]PRQ10061.1 Cyclopentanol dehydrogenase [Enhygromyxa salina]
MSNALKGRVVVVTGGTGALGAAVAAALVDAGAVVHIPVLQAKGEVAFELAEHERVELRYEVDLADERAACAYFAEIPRPWATLNVAGGFTMAPLVDTSFSEFEHMWRINVVSCFLACRESVRRMREADEGGRIVNVSARPALVPTAGMIAYAAAKGAIAVMTQALAEELADEKIWVNAVAPSIIDTPANRAAMPTAAHDRWPSPEAITATILSLASPDNHCARGAVVPVYGQS